MTIITIARALLIYIISCVSASSSSSSFPSPAPSSSSSSLISSNTFDAALELAPVELAAPAPV